MRQQGRVAFLGLAFLLLPTLAACSRSPSGGSVRAQSSSASGSSARSGALPDGWIQRRTATRPVEAAVQDDGPVVVAVHGMGDRPESFARLFEGFPEAALFIFPRAPKPYGDGYSWFTFKEGMTDAEFSAEVGAAEAALWEALGPLRERRRLVVTGFSQGGILSFAMAARHPERIRCALPVAGSLPGGLFPSARPAPTFAFHGNADRMISVGFARQTVDGFRAVGGQAELQEFSGIGHTVPVPMRSALYTKLGACLRDG